MGPEIVTKLDPPLSYCPVTASWPSFFPRGLMLRDKTVAASLGPLEWASCSQYWKRWGWNRKRRRSLPVRNVQWWIATRMLDWGASRLYYKRLLPYLLTTERGKKGDSSNHFSKRFSQHEYGNVQGGNSERKQFCNLRGSRWDRMFLSRMLSTCYTRPCGNADRAVIVPSAEAVLSM